MQRRGGNVIISKGRSLKKSNAALFNKIESTYGVSPGVLLAIWGMETGFGASMGKQNTVSAIVTLAYDCRRPGFFTPHAIAALLLVDRGALSAGSVGAMHGEIGHTQFLPGNVLKYGVGNKNLRDKTTALTSTANFLRATAGRAAQAPRAIWARSRAGIRPASISRRSPRIDHRHRTANRVKSRSNKSKPGHVLGLLCWCANQLFRLRAASVRSRSALRRMKPSASFWS